MSPPPGPGHGPVDSQPQSSATRPPTTNDRRRPLTLQAPLAPKPVPQEKLAHALDLYTKYLLACHTHTPPESTSSHYLGSTTAPSECSQTSQNDPAPESMVVFSGNLSPVSPSTKGKSKELVAFDGSIVKTRTRKRLSPKTRAKAALIRYLGSCESCHGRSVSVCLLNATFKPFADTPQCPLDHHDIAALEAARKAAAFRQQHPEHPTYPLSASTSNSSQYVPHNTSDQSDDASTLQANTLMGVGQSVESYEPNMLDISAVATSIESFNQEIPSPEPAYYVPLESRSTPPFTTQDDSRPSDLFLGTWRPNYYYCNAVTGCREIFNDIESLQSHFADAHFSFERLPAPLRFICLSCNTLNDRYEGPCASCGQAIIDVQVWGKFIWDQPQYPPIGQSVSNSDLQSLSSIIPLSSDYAVMDLHYGLGPNGRNWVDGGSDGGATGGHFFERGSE